MTLIPEALAHPTEQRLYAISLFILVQAYKVYALLFTATTTASLAKVVAADAALLLGIPLLRIPRINYGRKVAWGLVAAMAGVDWLLFGGWRSIPFGSLIPSALTGALTYYPTLSSGRARLRDVVKPDSHLLGAFTLHILPYSTARIPVVPSSQPLPCLSPQNRLVNVPITFNTTTPHLIEYSLTLPSSGKVVFVNVTASDLEEIKVSKRHLLTHHPVAPEDILDDDDEDEEEDLEDLQALASQKRKLESIQKKTAALSSIVGQSNLVTLSLPISQPATVRLSRVWAASGAEFRIARSAEGMRIWECPEAEFVPPSVQPGKKAGGPVLPEERCVGETDTLKVRVKGSGGGLKVKWEARNEAGVLLEEGWLEGIGDEDAASPALEAKEESTEGLPLVRTEGETPLALPQSHVAALPISFPAKGSKTYTLTGLSSPHTPLLSLPSIKGATSFTYTVLSSPSISFPTSYTPSNPLRLLHPEHASKDYSRPKLTLLATEAEKGRFVTAKVKFVRTDGGEGWEREMEVGGKTTSVEVEDGEGTYRIVGVQGGRCAGEIREPSEVRVERVAIPEVGMEVRRLQDDCAGELGFVASLTLRGAPPFRLTYSVAAQSSSPSIRTKVIQSLQEELTFQEDNEGTYTYRFISIADKNYPLGIDLDGERKIEDVVQVVHPLAKAEMVGKAKKVMWECEGGEVVAEVELKGKAPFTLTVITTSPKAREVVTLRDLPQARQRIQVKVPEERLATGGNFTISLGEVRDGNGCLRRLSGKGMEVEVRKGRPTARIYAKGAQRSVVVAKGREVSIPLRLTGEKPWTVQYSNSNLPKQTLSVKLQSPNSQLLVDQAGVYQILEVKDAHCSGSIVANEDTFTIEHLPQPSLGLSSDVGILSKDGSVVRPAVCVGIEDQFSLKMAGQAPFSISYTHSHTLKSHRTQSKPLTLGAVQSVKTFPLETSDPGQHTYAFSAIGDTHYLPITSGLVSPAKSGNLVVHQQVYARPSAAFEITSTPISLCSNAVLSPATSGAKGHILLQGKAPFDLELSIRTVTSPTPVVKWIRGITKNEWKLDVPDFEFAFVGMYEVAIASVRDATGCAEEVLEVGGEGRVVKVEVAETASVVTVRKGRDVCVGEELEFGLRGQAPWTLSYTWNNKLSTTTSKSSKFSRLSDRPGEFKIVSIAHEKNHCKVVVDDIERTVHALPSASISAGREFIETVEEGEQAEIIFTFEGEAPFSFSYTRSDGEGRNAKVLETHTVTAIPESTYSIFASTEGTWRVTMVEDRWCRYPPLKGSSPASSAGEQKAMMLEGIDPFPPLIKG